MTELEAHARADQIVQHHLSDPLELRSFVARCLLADAHIAAQDATIAAQAETVKSLTERAEKAEAIVAECRAANFIDERGVVRKVLGGLPATADGFIVGANAYFYHPDVGEVECQYHCDSGMWAQPSDSTHPKYGLMFFVRDCYSSRESAESAAKELAEKAKEGK